MNSKHLHLLRLLESEAMPLTAKSLADKLAVSARTIMNYVSFLNSSFPGSISSSRHGYTLSETGRQTLRCHRKKSSSTRADLSRKDKLLLKLLLNPGQPLLLQDFASQIHISPESVQKDIALLRFHLRDFSLKLRLREGKLSLIGQEQNKRSLLGHTINSCLAYTRLSLKALQEYFPTLPVTKLQADLRKAIDENGYLLSSPLWPNLMRDILVSAQRVMHGFFIPSSEEMEILHVTFDAASILFPFCGTLPHSELCWLQRLLGGYLLPKNFCTASYEEIFLHLPRSSQNVLRELFPWMKTALPFLPLTEHFRIRFALNVHNLLQRKSLGSITSNSQREDMKWASPFAFCCAMQTASQLGRLTGMYFSEDDAAYLAVHMGLALQKQQKDMDAISCGLLIPPYFDYDQELRQALLSYFPKEIRIEAASTDEGNLSCLEQVQLVISTMPLPSGFPVDWVTTNPLLNLPKRQEISRLIERKQRENRWHIMHQFLQAHTSLETTPANPFFRNKTWTLFGHTAICMELLEDTEKRLVIHWPDKPLFRDGHSVYIFLHLSFPKKDWELCCYILDSLSFHLQYLPPKKNGQASLLDLMDFLQRSICL